MHSPVLSYIGKLEHRFPCPRGSGINPQKIPGDSLSLGGVKCDTGILYFWGKEKKFGDPNPHVAQGSTLVSRLRNRSLE